MRTLFKLLMIISLAMVLFSGCAEKIEPSLYDPNAGSGPQPVVTAIDPPGSAFAVINNVTLTGKNFSSEAAKNFVYFNGTPGTVLTASATQLYVKPPYVLGDSIVVKVAVHGAELFSDEVVYTFEDPAPVVYRFGEGYVPYAVTSDAQGNVYVSLVVNGAGQGVKKITPAGVMEDYAPKGGETFWADMKMGPGGVIYAVRNVRAIFQIPDGGGASSTWSVIPTSTVKLSAIDFDADDNMWAAGNNANVFRLTPAKDLKEFPFIADVKAVRVAGGYLYLAGERDGAMKVWRMQIVSADELGAEEEVFDFSAVWPDYGIYALTAAQDGTLYIGTDGPESVVAVHPDGTGEALYSGLFENAPTISFSWGTGTKLYMTRGEAGEVGPTVLKVEMEKAGAPQYGRD